MSNLIKIQKCSLKEDKITVECFVEANLYPSVLGCTIKNSNGKEYDLQWVSIDESKELELGIALKEEVLFEFNSEGNEGTLIMALWRDDTFKDRFYSTEWTKIQIEKTCMEQLIDTETFKKVVMEVLSAPENDDLDEKQLEEKYTELSNEIIYNVFRELLYHFPYDKSGESDNILKSGDDELISKMILEKIPEAKEISKSALLKFRDSRNIL